MIADTTTDMLSDSKGMAGLETQLLVIGDSHANFWNGTGDWHGDNTITGIVATAIPGALAYNLVAQASTTNSRQKVFQTLHAAHENGFRGWLMLGFGTVDCETFIWQHANSLGFEGAVAVVIERYVSFILEVRQLHPQIVIWGPIASKKATVHDIVVGNQVERNLAILVFTAMLKVRLAGHGIQVLSMAEEMLERNGHTREDVFLHDMSHASQILMPYALQIVNHALSLNLRKRELPVTFTEQKLTAFEDTSYIHKFECMWLQVVLTEGAQMVTEVCLPRTIFSQVMRVRIATSIDNKTFEFNEATCSGKVNGPKEMHSIPVGRHARKVLIYAEMRPLTSEEISIYVRASDMHSAPEYNYKSLLSLRDQIVPELAKPQETDHRTIPTVTEVVFSAPPDFLVVNNNA